MTRRALIFAAVFCPSLAFGLVIFMGPNKGCFGTPAAGGGGGGGGGGPNTSDVGMYLNCDSRTATTLTKGVGTVTIGAAYTSVAGVVGNGLDNNNLGNSGGKITISTDSLNFAKGRFGFSMYVRETGAPADGDPFWGDGSTGTVATAKFHLQVNASGNWTWDFAGATQLNLGSLAANTTHFIEIAFDTTTVTLGAPSKIYDNGTLIGTQTGSPSGTPTPIGIHVGGQDGNATSLILDQVMFSTNPLKDLNALKALSSF